MRFSIVENKSNVEIRYSKQISNNCSLRVKSLINSVADSMIESFHRDLLDFVWKSPEDLAVKEDLLRKKNKLWEAMEEDEQLDILRREFNLSPNVEVIDVDSESQIDFVKLQEEQRQRAKLYENMQNENFLNSQWKIFPNEDDTTSTKTGAEQRDSSNNNIEYDSFTTKADQLQRTRIDHSLDSQDDLATDSLMKELNGTSLSLSSESASASTTTNLDSNDEICLPLVKVWTKLSNMTTNDFLSSLVIERIHQWANSYVLKGVGVTLIITNHGCQLSFGLSEEVVSDIIVFHNDSCVGVSMNFHWCNGFAGNEIDLQRLKESLSTPIAVLTQSLQNELSSLDLSCLPKTLFPPENQSFTSWSKAEEIPLNSQLKSEPQLQEDTNWKHSVENFDSIEDKERAFQQILQSLNQLNNINSSGEILDLSDRSRKESKKVSIDSVTAERGKAVGVDVAAYNSPDLQAEVVNQLNIILRRTREQGYYRVLQETNVSASLFHNASKAAESGSNQPRDVNMTPVPKKQVLDSLFTIGREISELNLQKILDRPSSNPYFESAEELKLPPPQFPVQLDDMESLKSGERIDIFAGPHGLYQNTVDPNLPSMRERYAQSEVAVASSVGTSLTMGDNAAFPSELNSRIGKGLTPEEKKLLLESMQIAETNERKTGRRGYDRSDAEDEMITVDSESEIAVQKEDSQWMQQQYLRVDDRSAFENDQRRFNMLVTELERAPVEVHDMIINGFRDVLLSDHCLLLLKLALAKEHRHRFNSEEGDSPTHAEGEPNFKQRKLDRSTLFTRIAEKAAELHNELMQLMEEESVRHFQTIAEICDVSTAFQNANPVEFLNRLDALKPKFDTDLLAFVNHQIYDETLRLQRHEEKLKSLASLESSARRGGDGVAGLLDLQQEDKLRRWLVVLQILQQGILAELEHRFESQIEMLTILLRIFDPNVRLPLFQRYVAKTPPIDLFAFRALAINMVDRLLDASKLRNDASIDQFWKNGGMGKTPEQWRWMLTCLRTEIEEFLSEQVIAARIHEYSKELAEQGLQLASRHRNPLTQAAMESADRLEQLTVSNNWLQSDRGNSHRNKNKRPPSNFIPI